MADSKKRKERSGGTGAERDGKRSKVRSFNWIVSRFEMKGQGCDLWGDAALVLICYSRFGSL